MIPVIIAALVATLWIAWASDMAYQRATRPSLAELAKKIGLDFDSTYHRLADRSFLEALEDLPPIPDAPDGTAVYSPRVPWQE